MIKAKRPASKAAILMLAIAPAAALLSAHRAGAADATWLAAPTNGNWITTTETNWSTGATTFAGSASGNSNPDIATFSATSSVTTINITNSLTLGSILFDTASASAYTINRTAGTFRVSDGGSISSTATVINPELITAAMTLNATSSAATTNSYTFNNDSTTSAATLTFSGAITTGSGAANLVTTFTLSGANTGNNLISGVISDQGTAKPLNLIKSGAGTWIFSGNNNYSGTTTINGGILQIGNVGATSTTGCIGLGTITDNGSLIFNRSNTLTVANAITGNGSVSQTGSGTLTLSGNNSYTGTTFIGGNGTLSVGSANALGNSSLSFSTTTAGSLDLNGFDSTVTSLSGNNLALIFDNNATSGTTTLTLNGPATSTYSGVIADGFSRFVALNITGGANLTLTGLNTYTGGTTIDNGALTIDDAGSLGSEGGVLTINNGTLHIPASAGNFTENRTFQLAAANSAIQVDPGIVFTIGGSVMDFTGPGTLNKTGTGTLFLDSPDFYTGGTTISAGKIQLGDNAALGAGPLVMVAGTTLDMNGFSATAGTLSGAGTITSSVSGAITLTLGDSTNGTFTGFIQNGSGTISFVKQGTGSQSLFGANSYTGTTRITAGTLVINTPASLGSTTGGNVTILSGGTLDLSGNTTSNLNFGAKQFIIAGAGADGVSGAIINNGSIQTAAFQNILLSADATIGGSFRFDIRNGVATLDLATHTLTKTGTNQFSIVGATIKNGGAIIVSQGILSLETTTTTTGSGNITYNAGTTAQFFSNSGTSITWPLTFMGNNIIGNGSGTFATIPAPIILQGNVTFEPTNSGNASPTSNNPLTLTGNISQSGGAFGITKLGVNTLTLSGNNTWSGPTNIQQGTVFLNSANALPANANVTLGSGATSGILDLNGHTISLSGLSVSGSAGSTNAIGSSSTTTPSTINYNGGASTFSGTIGNIGAGNQNLALVINSGTLTLTNPANTYSGPTTLAGGVLSVSADGNLGASTGPLTFSGGALQVTGTVFTNLTRTVNWSTAGGTFDINNAGNSFTINSPLTGAGLTKIGPGTLVLAQNTSVTDASPTTVSAGTLQFNGPTNSLAAITGTGAIIVSTGSSLTTTSIQANSLAVNGSTQISTSSLNTLNSLTLAGTTGAWTGALDITTSKIIVEDSSPNRAADLALLKDAAANTAGNTVGIYSSTAATANQNAGRTDLAVVVSDNAVRLAVFPTDGLNFGGTGNVDNTSILITTAIEGDANLDGVVDIKDLQDLANHWQQPATDWSQADYDGNGIVDILDLQALANHWQSGVGAGGGGGGSGQSFSQALSLISQFGTTNVPEPASLTMLAVGALTLAKRRKR